MTLCIDEVSALVVDIGTSSVRAGYAGDDTPRAIIPTHYGYMSTNPDADVVMGDTGENNAESSKSKFAKLYIGQSGPSIWREGMEVANPIVDGLSESMLCNNYLWLCVLILNCVVNDFSPIKPLVDHAISDVMRCNPAEHPILVTEPTWNTPANRERMAEIMFEEFQVPAFYIANTGVLNA